MVTQSPGDGAPVNISGDNGPVSITGGPGGIHGDGGAVHITGGRGGDVINHPIPSPPTKKRWFEKPLGIVLLSVFAAVLSGAILYLVGWL